MSVKIVRNPKKIALIGAPSSAGAHGPGAEGAPAALRNAGLAAGLQSAGFEVSDLGDGPVTLYAPDEEHPRARNVPAALEAIAALRLRVEQAVKSGALALVLGGDCAITPGTIAGARRYYRELGLIWLDRDADLNVPATSPSGTLHGMSVAHITGRGAPEMVRFFAEPPLVRDPNLALFGLERLDPPEEQLLASTPIRSYPAAEVARRGVAPASRAALDRIHSAFMPFVVHFDVDVISSEDFRACEFPGTGGLRLAEVRQALELFLREPQAIALEVTEYVPERDPDGSAAKLLVDVISAALEARLASLTGPAPAPPAEEAASAPAETTAASAPAPTEVPLEPAPATVPDTAQVPAPTADSPSSTSASADTSADPRADDSSSNPSAVSS